MQTASVIGREVPLKLLRAVWDAPASIDVHLLELKRQEFLYERGAAGEQTYVFKHALTQDVAYESLLSPARQALHEAIARALETMHEDRLEEYYERLAHHYSQSANRDKALDYLELANQKATTANALQEALAYFEQAMAILDTMPESKENRRKRVALIGNQFIVFWLLIRPSEYHNILDRYEAIAATVDDPILLARFKFAVGHCQWIFGLPNKPLPNIIDALKLCEAAGNAGEAARYCSMLQWLRLYPGNFEEALSWKGPGAAGVGPAP